jgi:hypothetical protein
MQRIARMRTDFLGFVIAMVTIVTASNVLVEFAINDWLTWAAFTYPVSFLVTDLTNRKLGPVFARRVVYSGFAVAVALSAALATPRIALGSGVAFLAAQLLDVYVFDRLRRRVWWLPPLFSSLIASALDTALFFSIAFASSDVPWVTLAVGDFGIKVVMALALLLPFRGLLAVTAPQPLSSVRPS